MSGPVESAIAIQAQGNARTNFSTVPVLSRRSDWIGFPDSESVLATISPPNRLLRTSDALPPAQIGVGCDVQRGLACNVMRIQTPSVR